MSAPGLTEFIYLFAVIPKYWHIPRVIQYILLAYLTSNSLYFPLPHPDTVLFPTIGKQLVCSLYLWVCCFSVIFTNLFYFLDAHYKWFCTVFVFLCLIYFTFSIMPFKSICVAANGKISSFLMCSVLFHYIYILYLLYQFTCWWTLMLLSYLGNCK